MISTLFLLLYVIFFTGLILLPLAPLWPLRQTLKMQNEPKCKTAQILLIPFKTRINKKVLHTPQSKNKPKRTQIKARRHELPDDAYAPPDHSARYKKMTNEPNYKISKMIVSHFLNNTNDYSRTTENHKNEPKTNPIQVDISQ